MTKKINHSSFLMPIFPILLVFLSLTMSFSSCDENGKIDINGVIKKPDNASITLNVTEVTHNSIAGEIEIKTNNTVYLKGLRYQIDGQSKEIYINEGTNEFIIEKLNSNTTYKLVAFADIDGHDDIVSSKEVEAKTTALPDYTLVFADEFDVDGKPASHWSYEKGYVRNNEDQYYTDHIENAYVENGYLHITGRRNHLGYPYTSSSLTTQKSFTFMYGRLEVRAKIPVFGGSWPAIWTLGNQYNWPSNGEVDVMEYYSGYILANACWGSNKQWVGVWNAKKIPYSQFTNKDPDWASKFHTWVMDWDEDYMKIYLDDELLNTIDLSRTFNQGGYMNNRENPFRAHKEGFGHYILVNLALGGDNGGTIDNSVFPVQYLIDYVRVYQRERRP